MMNKHRAFGPRPAFAEDEVCPLCEEPITAGDWTTLIPIPGTEKDGLVRCDHVHYLCAYGEEYQPKQEGATDGTV